MANETLTSTMIAVEHVTIPSGQPFDAVKAKLEGLLPQLDSAIYQHLQKGEGEQALQRMEAAPPLSIFSARDHGALLIITGQSRRAIQYEIGNPLTASKMTRHQISAALYAPIRVLLREDATGAVAFEYDRPAAVFGQFHHPDIDGVAKALDHTLQAALTAAAS